MVFHGRIPEKCINVKTLATDCTDEHRSTTELSVKIRVHPCRILWGLRLDAPSRPVLQIPPRAWDRGRLDRCLLAVPPVLYADETSAFLAGCC